MTSASVGGTYGNYGGGFQGACSAFGEDTCDFQRGIDGYKLCSTLEFVVSKAQCIHPEDPCTFELAAAAGEPYSASTSDTGLGAVDNDYAEAQECLQARNNETECSSLPQCAFDSFVCVCDGTDSGSDTGAYATAAPPGPGNYNQGGNYNQNSNYDYGSRSEISADGTCTQPIDPAGEWLPFTHSPGLATKAQCETNPDATCSWVENGICNCPLDQAAVDEATLAQSTVAAAHAATSPVPLAMVRSASAGSFMA